MRIGSLFSGAGGLDLAVEAVFGGTTVWHAEIDKAASKVLAHRWPDVPNLGDITQINWANWKPMLEVDVLCGGFPCQDVSAAGKRAGIKDGTRSGLWSVFAEAIDILRPPIVVIENVRGLLSATAERTVDDGRDPLELGAAGVGDGAGRPVLRAAGAVLGTLCDLGYDAQWATVAAGDIGAPHRRERVFIVAHRSGDVPHPGHDARRPQQRVEHEVKTGRFGQSGNELAADTENCGKTDKQAGGDDVTQPIRPVNRAGVGDRAGDPAAGVHVVGGVTAGLAADRAAADPGGDGLSRGAQRHIKPTARVEAPRRDDPDRRAVADGGDHGRTTVDLLPTPRSSDCFGAGHHGDGGMDLRTTVTLLPTPAAGNFNDGEDAQQWLARREAVKERLNNGNGMGMPLSVAVQLEWGKYEPAIRRWESLTRPAPPPTEPNKNGNPRLAAAFSEWLMGWPDGWVTDPDIGISRNDQLRIVGNGVCPQQAATALRYLLNIAARSA